MTITIHRGMNQIGGCITEIATSTTRILIDMGQNLPDGDGVVNDSFANKDVIKRLTLGIKAIFYTHCHGDHIGLFKYIPENVEQYIGETAKRVLLVTYKNRAFTPDIKDITPDDYHTLETFKTYTANNPVKVGDITVTPYFVSHSACDAHMFLIEAGGKRVLHTGDFRGHGYLSKGLIPAIKKYVLKKPVDVLITEGTMLSRMDERVEHESSIQKKAKALMKKYKNVFVLCSSTDMERLASFRAAYLAAKSGSPFVCDDTQKEVLQIFSETSGKKSPLFDFSKDRTVYDFSVTNKNLIKRISGKGCCMLVRVSKKFEGYLDFLKHNGLNMQESVLIFSMWGGYIDPNSKHAKKSYLDFVAKFPVVERLHTSGHASADCLAEVCNLVNPTAAIIPIHSEQSEQYRKLQITDVLKGKIITASCKKWKFDIMIREIDSSYEKFLNNLSKSIHVEYQPVEIINDTNEKIFTAVETGDVGKVKEALRKERINAASLYGYKSIVLAAERVNMDILKMLLENGKNINRESFWSNRYKPALSALKTASCNGNIDVVKLLLEYGANAVKKDMDKALNEAISKNNIELLNILLEAGAKFQYPVIMSAIEKGNVEVVKILLKHRRSKLPKNDLTEAFIKALSNGNLEMVRFLLELGADVNEKDKKGFSAMMYAVENKDTAIVEMLKNAEKYSKKKKNLCKSVSSASSAY